MKVDKSKNQSQEKKHKGFKPASPTKLTPVSMESKKFEATIQNAQAQSMRTKARRGNR